MNREVDYRSDTVTHPTDEMREAMATAVVGDDVFEDDPTLKELEWMTTQLTGKEAALFMISGTMGNQVALKVHTRPQDEIILGLKSHIFNYEVGGAGFHCGAQTNTIEEIKGMMPLEEIKKRIRPKNIHFARTSLICIENTHNFEGGSITSLDHMKDVFNIAGDNNLRVHLDGARLFNASAASGISIKDYCSQADSVMFCLSKGLCAPMGSMLAGSGAFIAEARRIRKSYGGGIRQGGIVAAAGIVALKKMTERLREDHRRARLLAEQLVGFPQFEIDIEQIQTNIFFSHYHHDNLPLKLFLTLLSRQNILCIPVAENTIRIVTHHGIEDQDIERTIEVIKDIFRLSREDQLWS